MVEPGSVLEDDGADIPLLLSELQHTSKKSVASELQHTSKNSVACGQCVVGSSRAERRRWRDGLGR